MKKLLMFLLCTVIMISAAFPLCAETITNLPGSASQTLTVKYINNSPGVSSSVSQGETEGQLPDGTDFSVEDLPAAATRISIHPVQKSEQEAYEWIESSLGKKVQVLSPYYLSCTDGNGNEVSNQGAKVTLDVPEGTEGTVVVYGLDSSGKKEVISASYQGNQVTFTATGASFYVIGIADKNPPTSDRAVLLYAGLCVGVILAAGALYAFRKKKA